VTKIRFTDSFSYKLPIPNSIEIRSEVFEHETDGRMGTLCKESIHRHVFVSVKHKWKLHTECNNCMILNFRQHFPSVCRYANRCNGEDISKI